MSEAELRAKFDDNASGVLDAAAARPACAGDCADGESVGRSRSRRSLVGDRDDPSDGAHETRCSRWVCWSRGARCWRRRSGRVVPPTSPPRTPWGDPDLQGAYTNSDESLIPMERPETLAGEALDEITPEELARLNEQRNQDRIEADKQRWELRSPLHWFENHNPKNSRAWLVVDPPDGRIPPRRPKRSSAHAARAKARQGRGEADSYEDRSLYDRCITRGLPGSMMPAIYGNSYEIVQGPGFVAIGYEMVNELRVIPLDGRAARRLDDPRATWAMRAAASRATRSSSRRRTSPTSRRTAARASSCG